MGRPRSKEAMQHVGMQNNQLDFKKPNRTRRETKQKIIWRDELNILRGIAWQQTAQNRVKWEKILSSCSEVKQPKQNKNFQQQNWREDLTQILHSTSRSVLTWFCLFNEDVDNPDLSREAKKENATVD